MNATLWTKPCCGRASGQSTLSVLVCEPVHIRMAIWQPADHTSKSSPPFLYVGGAPSAGLPSATTTVTRSWVPQRVKAHTWPPPKVILIYLRPARCCREPVRVQLGLQVVLWSGSFERRRRPNGAPHPPRPRRALAPFLRSGRDRYITCPCHPSQLLPATPAVRVRPIPGKSRQFRAGAGKKNLRSRSSVADRCCYLSSGWSWTNNQHQHHITGHIFLGPIMSRRAGDPLTAAQGSIREICERTRPHVRLMPSVVPVAGS